MAQAAAADHARALAEELLGKHVVLALITPSLRGSRAPSTTPNSASDEAMSLEPHEGLDYAPRTTALRDRPRR